MNYGLYLSAAGALSSMHRQDIIANNLANMNTIGFKPESAFTRARLPERLESPGHFADPQEMLEQLGGGLLVQPTNIALKQGTLVQSGNDFDLGIEGRGFFVVRPADSVAPTDRRLTRDGRLTLNAANELVMVGTGHRVLGTDQQPIRLDPAAPLLAHSDGRLVQNGSIMGTLALVSPADPSHLIKAGDNLLRADLPATAFEQRPGGRIVQGSLEQSAVDPIIMLNSMIGASKAAQSNLKMMQYADNIIGQAINTMGRVA